MIRRVAVRGFRGITTRLTFNLGRVSLLSGPNGLGKTTFFDAIDWCLFGSAWRLGHVEGAVRSLYSDGTPSVTIGVVLDREEVTIERALDQVTVNGERVSDRELAERLSVDPDLFPPYTRDHGARIRRLLYLPQAEIREIVGSSSVDERAALFAALEGVPNAAVVASAIRRLKQRLEERSAAVSERLAILRVEAQALKDQTTAASIVQAEEEGALLAATSAALGTGAVASLEAARRAAGDQRRLVVERLTAQRTALRAIPALLAERHEASQTLESKRDELVQLSSRQEALAQAATGAAQALQAAQEHAAREEEALVQVETKLSSARRKASRSKELAQERERLTAATTEAEGTRGAFTEATNSVQKAEGTRSELRERVLRHRKRLGHLQRRMDLRSKAAELETARKRIASVSDAERNQHTALDAIVRQLQAAKTAYDEGLSRATALDRLQGQLVDVARGARDLGLKDCPLCGQQYESAEALLGHMRAAFSALSGDGKQPVDRGELDALKARHGELERDVSRLGRETVELAETERRLLLQVEDLSKAAGELEEPEGPEVGQLELALRSAESEARVCEDALVALTIDRDQKSSAAQRAADALASLQDVVSRMTAELNGEGATASEEVVAQLVAEAETVHRRRDGARRDLERLQVERQRLMTELGGLQPRITGVGAEVAAREAQLRDSEVRLAQIGGGRDDWSEELGRQLAATERSLSDLEALEERLGRALVSQERARSLALQENLAGDVERVGRSVAKIATALERLGAFEAAAQQAIKVASAGARGHLATAVQECVSALYPHRHLDQVLLEDGAVRLSDEMLTEGVDPEVYASSGQLNVLALAVFLGCAARQRVSRLPLIMLDEPVQNLDDICWFRKF